ncbi:NACHT domain-containing protein [Micromonospora sp. NPDC003241]
MGDWLEVSDKLGSVIGAFLAFVAVTITIGGLLRRRRTARTALAGQDLTALLQAQNHDAARHRYRFFGHVPALSEVYVRQQVAGPGAADLTIGIKQMLASSQHTILLGGAGAGKSALVAAAVAESAQEALRGRRPKVFTIAIAAADLVEQSLPGALALACRHDLRLDLPASTFDRPPARGARWRIMIDGVDEIIDPDARSRVLWSLRSRLAEPSVSHQLVVTTRPLPEDEMSGLRAPGVDVYELQPFDQDELDAFARRWFAARRPEMPAEAKELAVRFLARVAGARLGPVARVPLLTTIAAMVFEHDGDRPLPSSRAALYEQFVGHLVEGRRELRQLREVIEAALADRGESASALASWFRADFSGRVNGLLNAVGDANVDDPDADMVEAGLDWLRRSAGHDLAALIPNGRSLMSDLLQATGVVVARGRRLRFIHQSFAEYLAARCRAATFDEAKWCRLMTNPSGRNLAAFQVALQSDTDRLVARLLNEGLEPAAAGDLLADGIAVGPDTRGCIVQALIDDLAAGEGSDSLRILRELSVDADVLRRLGELAEDDAMNDWTRVTVASAIADVDRERGVPLLRSAAATADDAAVRDFAEDALFEMGLSAKPLPWDAGRFTGRHALGGIGRRELTTRANNIDIDDTERVAAAIRLADDGDDAALRGLLASPGIRDSERLRGAIALTDRGDDTALRLFAEGSTQSEFYDGASTVNQFLRFGALRELHRRDHPVIVELLSRFVSDATDVPATYGAAAMLGDLGHFDALIALASSRRVHSALAVAAARRLAQAAVPKTLRRAAEAVDQPGPAAWLAAGLGLPTRARLTRRQRIERWAILARQGDAEALRELRRRARSRIALGVLVALGDPVGVARARARRRDRVFAAALLGRTGQDPRWETLRGLDSSARLRFQAGTRLAYETGDLEPLINLIEDRRTPVRVAVRAADIVGRHGDWTAQEWKDEVREEFSPLGLGIRIEDRGIDRALRISALGIWRRLPHRYAARLEKVAAAPGTPTRLVLAVTQAGLPRQISGDLITAIAVDPCRSAWHRFLAARNLSRSGDPQGEQILRSLANDHTVPRYLRWLILEDRNWPDDWDEFRRHIDRYEEIEQAGALLRLPRLGLMLLSRPDPDTTRQ